MSAAPEGYNASPHQKDVYYREIKPNVADLINALAVLPPDTTFATMSSEWDGGVNEYPDGAWYYPQAKQVRIG